MFVQQCGHSSGDPIDLKHSQKPTRLCLLSIKLCINYPLLARLLGLQTRFTVQGISLQYCFRHIQAQNSLRQFKSFSAEYAEGSLTLLFLCLSIFLSPLTYPRPLGCRVWKEISLHVPAWMCQLVTPQTTPRGLWSIAVNAWLVRITSGHHTDTPTRTAGSQSRLT